LSRRTQRFGRWFHPVKSSVREELDEYKKIVQSISPLVGDADVSIEVFADLDTTGEQMLAQGREMFSWIPNAYIKYPCTHEELRPAEVSVRKAIEARKPQYMYLLSLAG